MKQQHIRTHVAKKEHTCSSCGRPIEPGEEYSRIADFLGEDFEIIKLHRGGCPTTKTRSRRGQLPKQGWERS